MKSIAENPENRFSKAAGQAHTAILRSHSNPIYYSRFRVPWKPNVDPLKFSLTELKLIYEEAPPQLKPGLLEFIWNRSDIPEVDRMDFLVQVMKTDASLTALEYAGRYFLQGAKVKETSSPLSVDDIVNWWEKHRSNVAGR